MFSVRLHNFILVLLLCLPFFSKAQLCNGSLGDPVVNITFGSGSNPGPSIPNTTYLYNGIDCPTDGQYAMRSSLLNCFNSTWHNLDQDHTPGDNNGYCMVVNASFTPGDFYVDTVKGLCEKTTYEFAAWIMNVLKPASCNNNGIKPEINFNIETTTGTVLGNYNTGLITADNVARWNQYGFFFTTPSGISNVVIRITNNASGGCGNDLALDDITFRACGPTVQASIQLGGGGNFLELCEGTSLTFPLTALVSSGYVQPEYQWQISTNAGSTWNNIPGANSTSYIRNTTGIGEYWYRLAVAEQGNINSTSCRVFSNIINVTVNPLPKPAASNNGPVCGNANAQLSASDGATYAWTGPNGFSATEQQPSFVASTASAGMYYVQVTSAKSCVQKDSTLLAVIPAPIANAGIDSAACEGTTITLNGTGGGLYEWSPATGLSNPLIANPVAIITDTIQYILTVTGINGCKSKDSVIIKSYQTPKVNAGIDLTTAEGQPVQLNGTITGGLFNFSWTPAFYLSNPLVLNPVANPPSDQTYTLMVNSLLGCGTASDNVFIRVYKKVVPPNAFSPNGDGIFDKWHIEALASYTNASIDVYNRYGQLVYTSKGYQNPWDGSFKNKALPVGTYYYLIDLKNNSPVLKGSVTIIR